MFRRPLTGGRRILHRTMTLAPWDYIETGPWTLCVTGTELVIERTEFDRLPDAMEWLARFYLPPVGGVTVGLIDYHQKYMVIYGSGVDGILVWGGTQRGFEELAKHYDPMDVAIWERSCAPEEVPHESVPD